MVIEEDLIGLIRASTKRLPKGTLDDWLCRRCNARQAQVVASTSSVSGPTTINLVDDSDDDIVEVTPST